MKSADAAAATTRTIAPKRTSRVLKPKTVFSPGRKQTRTHLGGGGRRKNDHTNIFTGSLFHTDAMRWANEVTKHTQANPLPKMANMRRPYLPGSKIVSAPFSKQKWPHLHTERMLILRGLGFINRNEEAAENSKGSTVRKGMTK